MSDSYEFIYFAVRGLGETSRLLFHAAGVEFKDTRLPLDVTTFARPEFDAMKAQGDFCDNMDRVPILIYNGTKIGQSKTIDRFLAKKFGFNGSNELEEARIDMITEHVRDIKQKYNDSKVGKTGDALNEAKAAFVAKDLKEWLAKLEKIVGDNGFSVGNKTSLADVHIYQLVKENFDDKEGALAAAGPKIAAIANNFEQSVASYLAARPVTIF